MADSLELRILTPQREICDETVSQVVAQGELGQFGVLPDHITFLTVLEPGPLTFHPVGGATETLVVKGGFAEVRDNLMTVLADDALPVERIDEQAARAELERAEAALADAPFGHPDHERLRREARWASTKLELARGGGKT
jgi:F-type H+-transporting ATPase subunit epsilon